MLTILPRMRKYSILRPLSRNRRIGSVLVLLVGLVLVSGNGCTSCEEWVHNGFKVGPNYHKPPAPVANEWIDSKSRGVNTATKDLACWWAAFNDPKLNSLIEAAYQQNLTLRS